MGWVFWGLAMAAPAAEDRAGLARVMELGEILLNPWSAEPERLAALEAVAADPAGLVFVRQAALDGDPEVRAAALSWLLKLDVPAGWEGVAAVASDPRLRRSERRQAAAAFTEGTTGVSSLRRLAEDPSTPSWLAREARLAYERGWPALAEQQPLDLRANSGLGAAATLAAAGMVGGTFFQAVGQAGQAEVGPVVGAVGGTLLGVGSAGARLAVRPVTEGQGLAFASGAGWGLTAGLWSTSLVYGPLAWRSGPPQDGGALLRAAGVGLGAGAGMLWAARDPSPADVLEVDLAGYLGSAVVLGAAGLAVWPTDELYASEYGPTTAEPTGEEGSAPFPEEAWREEHRRAGQVLAGASLAGATGGLVAGALLAPRWALDRRDVELGLVLGAEAAFVGQSLPVALGRDPSVLKGNVRLAWNAGLATSLLVTELAPPSPHHAPVSGLLALSGNATGTGMAQLGRARAEVVAGLGAASGLATTVTGLVVAPRLAPEAGAYTLAGVGSGLATAQVGLWSLVADVESAEVQSGLLWTTSGLSLPGLLAVGAWSDPRSDQVLVVGGGGLWGAVVGGLVPTVLQDQVALSAQAAGAALGSATGTVGAALACLPRAGLEPRQTILPQLGALGGGTSGLLVAALITDAPQGLAAGALSGVVVGGVSGAVVEARRPAPSERRAGRGVHRWQLSPFLSSDPSGLPTVGLQGVER